METNQYFSREGLEKIKQELEHRTNTMRTEIAVRIKEAKEQGDLSENAEYTEAKEAQSLNEGRIEELKSILDRAILIEDTNSNSSGIISVGSSITVESKDGSRSFVIVGAAESNPTEGFISNESPLGNAFLGHKKGDTIEVRTPKGLTKYTILNIK
ncbi:MAG: transcription elongation factor GreA [Candidatus Yanofskybacteria bacterium]|nr:transcription elongation factor GreA [Candidatus Yanofskybacteria bacterium]